MIRKLRKKFLFAAIVAVFLVLLVLIGSINILNYHNLIAEADDTLQILSSNRGSFPRQMFRTQDLPPERSNPADQESVSLEEGRERQLGMRRGGYGELAYQTRYFSVWFDAVGSCTQINLDYLASLTEEEARTLAETVYATGREKGFADAYRFCRTVCNEETLLLFLNCQRELSTFRSFLYASIGISLAGLFAVFLLLLLLSERIVHPIAESYEKQKRFITDAGHELKTPIAIIRADADVLESELEEDGNEWIADIRKQTHRLSDLTADLIYLSRMEEEDLLLQMQDLSLSELMEETAQSFQALALSKGTVFHSSVQPELHMNGDEKMIAKLISVLLDNALKYTPEGGDVELSLDRNGKYARLVVRNSTLPMEEGNADRLFDRFTRIDSSRNSGSGGFGLGLAIAKAVTEAHKGRIHAESVDGASFTVTVELPLS